MGWWGGSCYHSPSAITYIHNLKIKITKNCANKIIEIHSISTAVNTQVNTEVRKYVGLTPRVRNPTLLSISLVISYVNIELLPWINTRCWM